VQGVPLFVNATQAAGLLPIDVSKIGASALTFASHKWLMAGPGGTVLYVAPGMRGEGFPPLAGWLSARNPEEYNNHHFFPAKEARAVELGVTSILPLIALEAAIKFLGRFNAQIVRDRVLDLSEQLISGLLAKDARVITPIERAKHAGIVSVLRSDAEEFVEKMEKKGIYIAARSPEKKDKDITVRISPHFYNSADEINTLLDNW
jgi:selenocysteine lyase/cysteine desulfurase